MTADTRAAVRWLERDYHQPGRFRKPSALVNHTPPGLFQLKPDHDCPCKDWPGYCGKTIDTPRELEAG